MSNSEVVANDKIGWKYLSLIGGNRVQKQHYFVDGRSICGRYMTFGDGGCTLDDGKPQRDECASCRRKLTPELAPKKKPRKKTFDPNPALEVAMAVVELMVAK